MSDKHVTSAALNPGSIGLGIDAGGTSTRWALADISGRVLANGRVDGLTALMMGSQAGRDQTVAILQRLANDALAAGMALPERVLAGFSGYSDDPGLRASLEALIANSLGLPDARVRVVGDIVLAYLDTFSPGGGYLVYAGTGSIAAYIDAHGQMHRVGGRGSLLDDGGSGHWIVREAIRHIWREEDERPGSWRNSRLALAVFEHIGGSQWARSREFFYQGTRGQIGALALAVAAAANDRDVVALGILRQAGAELARLALALTGRFGARPIALAGRVVQLHPAIEQSLRDSLGSATELRVVELHAHQTAARLAASNHPLLDLLSDRPAAPLTPQETPVNNPDRTAAENPFPPTTQRNTP